MADDTVESPRSFDPRHAVSVGSVQSLEAFRRVRILGVPVEGAAEAEAVQAIVDAARSGRGHWTITANLDHLRRYRREPTARRLIDGADLVLADGMPLIWTSRLAGAPLPERVAGSDMIWSICELASRCDVSVFLLGGDPGVADSAAQTLRERYVGLKIVGSLCPPLGFEGDEQELARIQREIVSAAPQLVLVGLGFPKQDLLIERLRGFLPGSSFIGVGISFSFVSGAVSRAPAWMRGVGLEWLYRLAHEPGRLLRRYLVDGVPFALVLFGSAICHRLGAGGGEDRWGEEPAGEGRQAVAGESDPLACNDAATS